MSASFVAGLPRRCAYCGRALGADQGAWRHEKECRARALSGLLSDEALAGLLARDLASPPTTVRCELQAALERARYFGD